MTKKKKKKNKIKKKKKIFKIVNILIIKNKIINVIKL